MNLHVLICTVQRCLSVAETAVLKSAMHEDQVKRGDVRAMIVTGPPGVGKSFGVEKVLSKHDVFADVAQNEKLKKYEVVKGAMSAIGLYKKLYEYSERKCILVFDDCDSVLLDDLSLNILKAALDSSKKRMIHWNTDSRLLRSEGVPNSFEFKGGAVFITNIKFDNVKSKKLRDHLEALESRCHYLDLTIDFSLCIHRLNILLLFFFGIGFSFVIFPLYH